MAKQEFEVTLTVGRFDHSICGPLVHWENREGILTMVLTVRRFDHVGRFETILTVGRFDRSI